MYGRKETSATRRKFWTSFGQYMKPIPGASGETMNWLNYKTGIKDIYFRMNANTSFASIAIECCQKDSVIRQYYFEQLRLYRSILEEAMGESWTWQQQYRDENDNLISRVYQQLNGVSIFHEPDWPEIISFLKPRLISLDDFWFQVKDFFETKSF